jgi:hypothetical protein
LARRLARELSLDEVASVAGGQCGTLYVCSSNAIGQIDTCVDCTPTGPTDTKVPEIWI